MAQKEIYIEFKRRLEELRIYVWCYDQEMTGMNLKGKSELIQWLSSYVRIEKNFYTMPFPVEEKTTIQIRHVNRREELVDHWIRKLFSSYLAPKLQYPGEE